MWIAAAEVAANQTFRVVPPPMVMGCRGALLRRMYLRTTAAVANRFIARPPNTRNRRDTMSKKSFIGAAIALAVLSTASLAAAPANAAAVYCKTAGVPQGCIVRPTAPVYVAPVARPIAAPIARPIYGPTTVKHVGYTRVTPYGVKHVGYTR